jgi:hypothetical protein
MPQNQTTPEKTLSNPWIGKGFCDPQQYKATIDRCEGGYHSLDMGIEMFKRLDKIFGNHSEALHDWAKTSLKHVEDSKEYGENKIVWKLIIKAVEKLAERTDKMAEGIQEKVVNEMISFKNENYGKSYFHVKQIKKFEKEFKDVQKTWLECLNKINDARQTYHDIGHKLRMARGADTVIQSDAGSSDEQKEKSTSSVKRRTSETETCEKKYRAILKDSESIRVKYESDMLQILKRTDDFEKKRLDHFKSIFIALQTATLIEHKTYDETMLKAFTAAIGHHDSEKDIIYFNSHYGSGKKTKWPEFEPLKE